MYLVNGVLTPAMRPETALEQLKETLAITLSNPVPLAALLDCAEHFIAHLNEFRHQLNLTDDDCAELRAFCQRDVLHAKLHHELGETPFSLRRTDYGQDSFERWCPLGVVVHITPGNAPLLPFFAVLESLLVGNINWLRPGHNDSGFTARLLSTFLRYDDSRQLSDYMAVLPVSTSELPLLLSYADGVSAWGSDAALQAIRQQIPPGCRWIDWGHRISFAWMTPAAINDTQLDALVDDVCCYDQQACSSPQIVFIDSDDRTLLQQTGERLASAFSRRASRWPALTPDAQEAADITTRSAFVALDDCFSEVTGQVWQGEGWRILWSHQSAIDPSPLFRTLLLRPLPAERLVATLRPWRRYLQSCGLAATEAELPTYLRLLLAAGVSRIVPLSAMHHGYSGEPHDGVYALSRLARRSSVVLATGRLRGHATLDVPPSAPAHLAGAGVMDKAAFLSGTLRESAQVFFRSGGSSGTPKLAGFSYRDYHRQMQAAADGLYAAGLDPQQDRIMNLFFAGHMYGGMLSFFTVLDKLGATHFPMGAPNDDDYSEIAQVIAAERIDALTGMSSTLYQLFWREEATLRRYGGIRKVFYAGEHMAASQRRFIESFGVTIICSALYGSVDAGPLGHACHASPDGVFHLLSDIQWLEILAVNADKPVRASEHGRLIFTSRAREGQHVVRYEIGDLGRWVAGPCPCGLPSPRFTLEGRHGHLVRIGTMFLQPAELAQRVNAPVQFIFDHDDTGCERIVVYSEEQREIVETRLRQDSELATALRDGLLSLEVNSCAAAYFERSTQSGKTPLVIDRRREDCE